MAEPTNSLLEKLGGLPARWASFTAFGSFVVYLLGYLAFRFQLSTYGVATNLDVWDQRYFFAGCRSMVYLVSSVPNFLLIVAVIVAIAYIPYKLVPVRLKEQVKDHAATWMAAPARLSLLGTLLALGLIQFVMRKCFLLSNLLLAKELPCDWIRNLLLSSPGNQSLYFSGMVGGTLLTSVLLFFATHSGSPATSLSRMLAGLLAFLVAIQLLLLPVNYGILIASQQLPRVSELGGSEKLVDGEEAWLVWESSETLTYLMRDANGKRTMIDIPKKEAKVRIVAYDPIFNLLFGGITKCQ